MLILCVLCAFVVKNGAGTVTLFASIAYSRMEKPCLG